MSDSPESVVRKFFAATHTSDVAELAEFFNFEAQGKWFALEVVGVFEIDGDGKIKRFRDYYDLQSLIDEVTAAFA
jgi:Limonene-1,2-epoxide hydrolase catalytic domain